MTRGTDVHEFMERVLKGADEIPHADDPYRGYKEAGLKWLLERKPDLSDAVSEEKVWSLRHGFAGKTDTIVTIAGSRTLLDWKTSKQLRPETALQTIAYKEAYNELFPNSPVEVRMAVRLGEDGSYEEKVYKNRDASDMSGFLGALDLFRWLHKRDYLKNMKEVEEAEVE